MLAGLPQEAEEEEAMSDFDRALAAAGWSDAYDRMSGHVYYVRPQSLHTRVSSSRKPLSSAS